MTVFFNYIHNLGTYERSRWNFQACRFSQFGSFHIAWRHWIFYLDLFPINEKIRPERFGPIATG